VRLDDAVARPPQLLGEKAEQHVFHARVAALQDCEVVAEDGVGLAVLERGDGGGSLRTRQEERQLAERLAGPEDLEEDAVSLRRRHARRKAATCDEVERIRRIVAMEDDFALLECPPSRYRKQLPDVLGVEICEQRPLHGLQVCVTNVTLATSCARTTRAATAPTLDR
jgi:hypothetical protein